MHAKYLDRQNKSTSLQSAVAKTCPKFVFADKKANAHVGLSRPLHREGIAQTSPTMFVAAKAVQDKTGSDLSTPLCLDGAASTCPGCNANAITPVRMVYATPSR